jgi:type IV pilus assembly protein PilC
MTNKLINKSINKLTNNELVAFFNQMEMIVHAGISVEEGISMMLEDSKEEEEKKLLKELHEKLEIGILFCETLKETGVFPDYAIHLVEIGEQTGHLDEVLGSLARYYERQEVLTKSIKNAITYPLIMIVMMGVIVFTLIVKVMPVFNQVYEQLGTSMSGIAATTLQMGELFSRYSIVFVIILVALIVSVLYLKNTKNGRNHTMKLLSHFKVCREIVEQIALARFADGVAMTLKSGLDIDDSLKLIRTLVENEKLQVKIDKCQELINEGESFSTAMNRAEIFTGLQARMAYIAAQTGTMDEVLEQVADQYEEESFFKIQSLVGIIEPTMVILVSVIVGMILLSVMLPLIGIISNL